MFNRPGLSVSLRAENLTNTLILHHYMCDTLTKIENAKTFNEASHFIMQLMAFFHAEPQLRCDGTFTFKFKEFSVPAEYHAADAKTIDNPEQETILFTNTPTGVEVGMTFRLFSTAGHAVPVTVHSADLDFVRSGEFGNLFNRQ